MTLKEALQALLDGKTLRYGNLYNVWINEKGVLVTDHKSPSTESFNQSTFNKGMWQLEEEK